MLVLELSAPTDAVAGRQCHARAHPGLGLLDEADQVAAGHVGDHHAVTAAHFTVDFHRPALARQPGERFQRNALAVRGHDAQRCELRWRDLHAVRSPDHDRNAAIAIDHTARALSFELCAQSILHVFHRQAETSGIESVDHHPQVLNAVVLDGVDILIAWHRFHERFDLTCQFVELVEFGAEDLDGQITAHADDHFRDAHIDRLSEAVADAGHLIKHFPDARNQRALVCQFPFRPGLEDQEGVGLVKAHRIEPDFVGPGTRNDTGDFRNLAHQRLMNFQVQRGCFRKTDGGQLLDSHDDVALVHRRQKGFADLRVDPGGQHQHQAGDEVDAPLMAERPTEHRFIEPEQLARKPRILMRDLFQQERRHDRDDRERKHERADQCKDDRQCHGNKIFSFQPLKRQERQKHRDDDQDAGRHRH